MSYFHETSSKIPFEQRSQILWNGTLVQKSSRFTVLLMGVVGITSLFMQGTIFFSIIFWKTENTEQTCFAAREHLVYDTNCGHCGYMNRG